MLLAEIRIGGAARRIARKCRAVVLRAATRTRYPAACHSPRTGTRSENGCARVEKRGEAAVQNAGSHAPFLPIVFAHYGNSDYLRYSLGQARQHNPESPIYLLGDETNDCHDMVEQRRFLNYFEGAREFAGVYRHLSIILSVIFLFSELNFTQRFP